MAIKTATRAKPDSATVRHVRRNGQQLVVLEESEYERLRMKADEWEPLLPELDADGTYPAKEYMLASLARKIIRHRRMLGLSQAELARRRHPPGNPEPHRARQAFAERADRGEDRPGAEEGGGGGQRIVF